MTAMLLAMLARSAGLRLMIATGCAASIIQATGSRDDSERCDGQRQHTDAYAHFIGRQRWKAAGLASRLRPLLSNSRAAGSHFAARTCTPAGFTKRATHKSLVIVLAQQARAMPIHASLPRKKLQQRAACATF